MEGGGEGGCPIGCILIHSSFFHIVAHVDKTITKPTVSPQRGKI